VEDRADGKNGSGEAEDLEEDGRSRRGKENRNVEGGRSRRGKENRNVEGGRGGGSGDAAEGSSREEKVGRSRGSG